MEVTYRKYRTPFGAEYKLEDGVDGIWTGWNLRDVKAHARAAGASRVIVIDQHASIQRPKRLEYAVA